MSAEMSREEKIRALARVTGMPERRAQFIIDNQEKSVAGLKQGEAKIPPAVVLELPFSITLPWSCLISDNDRYGAIIVQHKGKPTPRLILAEGYKAARRSIQTLLREQLAGRLPVAFAIALHAKVFVPDNRPHDCPDFAKGCHDAMARQVFTSDVWIYDARWVRAGVDVDRPRAEITISRIMP